MKAFDRRFADHLAAAGWLAKDGVVVVGVSGGVDSMTLLHLMRFRDAPPPVRVHAAHVDHRMREGSGEDARWVGEICAGWGIPFHLREAGRAVETEAAGRELRYRFFEEVGRELGDGAVTMTAHTADDQAETVLFRAARGSGPRGLGGIREARSPSVVRPLLGFRRAEIEAYAAARGIPFREDPTNRDPRWTRNRLRHHVLPALEEAVPGAGAALAALARTSSMEAAGLDELLDERIAALGVGEGVAAGEAGGEGREAEKGVCAGGREGVGKGVDREARGAFSLDLAALRALSSPVLALVLRRAVQRLGGDPGRSATGGLVRFVREGASGRRVAVAGGVAVERHLDVLRIRRARARDGAGAGAAAEHGWVVEVSRDAHPPPGFTHIAYFAQNVKSPLTVRPWSPGDRMAMPYGRKKVKKLLLEARVSADEREGLPVVADASGSVVWIPGVVEPAEADVPAGGAGAARQGCWVAIRPTQGG